MKDAIKTDRINTVLSAILPYKTTGGMTGGNYRSYFFEE